MVYFESPSTSDIEDHAKTTSKGSDDNQSEEETMKIVPGETDEDNTAQVESLLQ